jgi:hypothetical protein
LYLSICSLHCQQVGKIAFGTSFFNVLSRRVSIPSTFHTFLCTPIGHLFLMVVESSYFYVIW